MILILIIFQEMKSLENILIYDVSYKNLIRAKNLRIRFYEINRFVRVYDRT